MLRTAHSVRCRHEAAAASPTVETSPTDPRSPSKTKGNCHNLLLVRVLCRGDARRLKSPTPSSTQHTSALSFPRFVSWSMMQAKSSRCGCSHCACGYPQLSPWTPTTADYAYDLDLRSISAVKLLHPQDRWRPCGCTNPSLKLAGSPQSPIPRRSVLFCLLHAFRWVF